MRFVYVKWRDAAHERGPLTVEEMDDEFDVDSAGILVRENKKLITLASDYYDGTKTFRDVTHIPKAYIVKRKNLGKL